MKTVGIALLFGLCCMIGFRLGARKTACLKTVRSLQSDLQLFSERIKADGGTLTEIAAKLNGTLAGILQTYLDLLAAGKGETDAAETASGLCSGCGTAHAGLKLFLNGLSAASRSDLIRRTQTLTSTLERAETEAESEAGQGRVFRIAGVLIGAALAILLL